MVFQNYALFPHMTVYENLAFPLRVRKISKDEADTDAERKLSQLSTAVRILQHVPVSPQLPLYMAKQLHESPELVQRMADDDGGALAALRQAVVLCLGHREARALHGEIARLRKVLKEEERRRRAASRGFLG